MKAMVNAFLSQAPKWQKEMELLRKYFLDSGLNETLKWGKPCYTFRQANIAVIQPFKNYVAILFVKGYLLQDSFGLLVKPGQNTRSASQLRFDSLEEIILKAELIRTYIYEAIEVEKAGLKVRSKKHSELVFPEELQDIFDVNPDLKAAFEALTPGRQRAYNIHFTQAKQSGTRIRRIEKNIARILMGKGLNDCICGHSGRMPNCDGSHKIMHQ